MEKQRYYISTAIAYTSGKPHIGNTYEVVLADVQSIPFDDSIRVQLMIPFNSIR